MNLGHEREWTISTILSGTMEGRLAVCATLAHNRGNQAKLGSTPNVSTNL